MATRNAQQADRGRQVVEFDEFIETQLRKTRSHVRSVDLAGSLLTLAAGTLAYFFLAAIVDHWVIAGGLGLWGRLLLLVAYVAAVLAYLATHVLPLLLKRINPVYAAHTIERSRPTLKNALVNFLFFRDNPAGVSEVVYHAIEEQAATNLAKVEVDVAVDRSKLIRIGYVLMGILIVCAVYTLVFPKDLLKTLGRVAMPWAEISQPTRTSIVEIEPGNAQAFRGQKIAVSARVRELPSDGKVMLIYTTADGQTVDRAIEMQLGDDGYRHNGTLPAGEGDLQQNLEYRIEAGDAISSRYRLEVVSAPTIVVRAVQYKYPSYTGLLDQRVEHQGDVKAIEGTEITLDAVANQDIQSADVDFECDRKPDQRMRSDKQQALATFRLALKDDRKTPEHGSYQLLFKNDKGQQNPQPVRQQIEISRDVAPEIQFVAPKKDEIDLPLNEAVQLELVANDPDFALRMVKLSATSGKLPLFDKILLDEVRRGQFVKKFRFEPRKLGLKAGDVVEYSALAEDNKDPRPNRTETTKRRIRIVSPDPRNSRQDQVAKNDSKDGEPSGDEEPQPGAAGNRGDDKQPRDKDAQGEPKSDKSPQAKGEKRDDAAQDQGDSQQPNEAKEAKEKDEGDAQASENSAGKPGQQRSADNKAGKSGEPPAADQNTPNEGVPSDGSDDGDAIERILKHRDEQQEKANPKPKDSQRNQRGDDKQTSSEQPKGEPQGSGKDQADAQQYQPSADGQKSPPKPGEKRDRGEQDGQPDQKQNVDQKQDPSQKPGDDQLPDPPDGEKGGEQPKPSKQQRDKSDPAAGQKEKGQKGAGAGDEDSTEDAAGGEKGQKGKPEKGSPKGDKSGKPSEDGEAGGEDSAEPGVRARESRRKPNPASGRMAKTRRKMATARANLNRAKPSQPTKMIAARQRRAKIRGRETANRKILAAKSREKSRTANRIRIRRTRKQRIGTPPTRIRPIAAIPTRGRTVRPSAASPTVSPSPAKGPSPKAIRRATGSKSQPAISRSPTPRVATARTRRESLARASQDPRTRDRPHLRNRSSRATKRRNLRRMTKIRKPTTRPSHPPTAGVRAIRKGAMTAIGPAAENAGADSRPTSRAPVGLARIRLPMKEPVVPTSLAPARPAIAPATVPRPTSRPARVGRKKATARRPSPRRAKATSRVRAMLQMAPIRNLRASRPRVIKREPPARRGRVAIPRGASRGIPRLRTHLSNRSRTRPRRLISITLAKRPIWRCAPEGSTQEGQSRPRPDESARLDAQGPGKFRQALGADAQAGPIAGRAGDRGSQGIGRDAAQFGVAAARHELEGQRGTR